MRSTGAHPNLADAWSWLARDAGPCLARLVPAVERELRREFLHAMPGQDEMVRHLGGAHVVDVKRTVVIQDFREPQLYIGAFGALQAHAFDAG